MSNEPVQWSTLTASQRNALVAQHVFGRKVVQWKADRDMLLERIGKPGQHESIPAYTESMDAAWLIMDHLKPGRRDKGETHKRGDFMHLATFVDQLCNMSTNWWSLTRDELCETICIAALRAQGVSIEIEEKQ